MNRLTLVLLLSFAGSFVASFATAQETPNIDASLDEEARALFAAGRAAFGAGRMEDALAHFQAAFDRSQRPELLYNVGLAADRLRRDQLALDAYEKYLDSVPDTEFRGMVEERIQFLRGALSTAATTARVISPTVADNPTPVIVEEPPRVEPMPQEPAVELAGGVPVSDTPTEPTELEAQPTPRNVLVPGIVTAASGVALVAVGAGLAVSAFNLGKDIEDTLSQVWTDALQDDYDAASRRAAWSRALGGRGARHGRGTLGDHLGTEVVRLGCRQRRRWNVSSSRVVLMRPAILILLGAAACVAPEPPGGQFICNVDDDCPEDFTCESDLHCYDRLPQCFIYGQQPGRSTGCGPSEGCYWRDGSVGGPVCQQRGLIGQYGGGCNPIEFELLEQRCAPGLVCVPFADDALCLRACDADDTCNGADTCSFFVAVERQHWWLGNYIAFCEPPST